MQPTPTEPSAQIFDLRAAIDVVRRHKLSVILITLVVTGLAVAMVYKRPPIYEATARVEVRPLNSQASVYGGFYDLQQSMSTEAERVNSQQVAEIVEKDPKAPVGAVAVGAVVPDTTFIDITCTTGAPETARDCANAYARAYIDDRRMQARTAYDLAADPLKEQIDAANDEISMLRAAGAKETDPDVTAKQSEIETARQQLLLIPLPSGTPAVPAFDAVAPSAPSNKSYVAIGVLAAILGFALGVGFAFLRERLDQRLAGRQDMEDALGAPVLAVVPRVPGWRNRNDTRIVSVAAPTSAAAEAYRTARTSLLYLMKEGGIQTLAVTGPGQGEGKTTTTVNIAVSLAQAGKRVIAVSCDLRRPRLARFFGIPNESGLSDVLIGRTEVKDALLKTEVPGLVIMPSGPVPPNPAELLGSTVFEDLIAQLRTVADIVLLDTPPSLVVADALEVAPRADGILVVADASSTHRSALLHLSSQIRRVGGTIIGAVLNNFDSSNAKYGETYGSYYGGAETYDTPLVLEDPSNGNGNGKHANGNGHHVAAQKPKKRQLLGRSKSS